MKVGSGGIVLFFFSVAAIWPWCLYCKVKKVLQKKSSRNATKQLIALLARERAFKSATNHPIAKQIPILNSLIGLKNITHIRERTKPRETGKKVFIKQPKPNLRQTSWSFAELQYFINYKAIVWGSLVSLLPALAKVTNSCYYQTLLPGLSS